MALPQPLHIVRLDGIHSEPPTFSPAFKYTYTEYPSTPFDTHTIVSRIKDADVVITTRIPITEETLQQCPRLKHVACLAIGTLQYLPRVSGPHLVSPFPYPSCLAQKFLLA